MIAPTIAAISLPPNDFKILQTLLKFVPCNFNPVLITEILFLSLYSDIPVPLPVHLLTGPL